MRGVNHVFEVEPIKFGFSLGNHGAVNAARENIKRRIETYMRTAIHPQTLTINRDAASTGDGNKVARVLKGRVMDGVAEDGIRVVVQENSGFGTAAKVRFVMSPLFGNEHDARSWARAQYEAE